MTQKGISFQEAARLLEKYGPNQLPEGKKKTKLDHFFNQFASPLIYILVAAAVITLILQDYTDSIVILIAVFVNTILGYYQEVKAEEALDALKKMLNPMAKVVRDGATHKVEVKDLVLGDYVVLGQGDKIPADGMLVESINLSVSEAILTGESKAVRKKNKDEVYMGTTVISGRGAYFVTATGNSTKMGSIAENITSVNEVQTPLQKRLDHLAKILAVIVIGFSGLILVIGLLTGRSFIEMFTTSVALAVAAIPEGLVISLTVILAVGMQRILKRKALVRKLVAAEALGSVTVIATDKTGTLTEGLMRVSQIDVTGEKAAAEISIYANNLEDPLEIAMWEWAQKQGFDAQNMADKAIREKETPFDSVRKYMSVKIDGKTYIKGAPEVVLKMTNASKKKQAEVQKTIAEWSENGLRIIGLAKKTGSKTTWVGIMGLEDPVRKDVSAVMKKCLRAGINIKMITGDYVGTAQAVWTQIYPKKEAVCIDGVELATLNDAELKKRVEEIDVFARVTPDQKIRIVDALQANNEIVALVGDGVNDAPAIKSADIGIVVGEASDVAKETADMVLLDSNFKTIVAAIEEGRSIFQNMKKVILYLLSDSFTEIILVIGSILLGLPLPLTAAQILWINVVTDGMPAIALTMEPKSKNLLKRKPIDPKMSLINRDMKVLIAIVSGITGILSLLIFMYYLPRTTVEHARSITFAALAFGTLVYIFSVRSLRRPIWHIDQFKNKLLLVSVCIGLILQLVAIHVKPFNTFLNAEPLLISEWLVVILFAIATIVFIEVTKLLSR